MAADILLEQSSFWDQIPSSWKNLLDQDELHAVERSIGTNYQPALNQIFRSLVVSPPKVKVLILGQDPYPRNEYAMGLAFSVPAETITLPASLRNIFK